MSNNYYEHNGNTYTENVDRCVCCVEVIPEGRQVCTVCEVDNSAYTYKTDFYPPLENKVIARVKLLGGGITFNFTDTTQFEMPTEEQRENLKKLLGIEIEIL